MILEKNRLIQQSYNLLYEFNTYNYKIWWFNKEIMSVIINMLIQLIFCCIIKTNIIAYSIITNFIQLYNFTTYKENLYNSYLCIMIVNLLN